MDDLKGIVFNIQRFCVNDGPGIRTTVFLKGCMLNCAWCHNPESKSPRPQIMYYTEKCVGCAECLSTCENGAHLFDGGIHIFERNKCISCGKCTAYCMGALELCGEEKSVDQVIDEVVKDVSFYKSSGGGMTLSGGDPFMQHGFSLALLKEAKRRGLHACIETCGYVARDVLEAFIPYVDLFLWDMKESDSERHKSFTGVPNERILDNLRFLNEKGASVVLRCPIIPGYNDREEHLLSIGALAEELDCVTHVEVEPYHPLGSSKSVALGVEYPLGNMGFLEDDRVEWIIATISSKTEKTVKKA